MTIVNLFNLKDVVYIRYEKNQEPHTVKAICVDDCGVIRYRLNYWDNKWYEEYVLSTKPTLRP